MIGGFGFPTQESSYKHDTSKQKNELIHVLKRQEELWGKGLEQESLVQLRKGINLLKFIVRNETIEESKDAYEEKLRQLRNRLKQRQENISPSSYHNTGGTNQKKPYYKSPKKGIGSNDKQTLELQEKLSEAIVTEKPEVKWEDVSGLENAKNALKEAVVMPIKFPQVFTGSRKPWKGILLYGPPGTGKTFLAKACATEAEGTFFSVSSSDLMSKYVGESEKQIRNLFNLARAKKPSIIFIDQIDSMCGNRSDGENESSRRVKTEFLVQMQGVGKDDKGILVLGATNLPWALDPAIRRRFDRRIYIALPEFEARLKMLKHNMKHNKHNLTEDDFKEFAERTDNFSGSDIATLVRDAVYEPLRRLQSATKFKKVGDKYMPCREGEDGEPGNWQKFPREQIDIGLVEKADFIAVLGQNKPSVDQKQLADYEDFTQTFGQDG